jgi:CPA2 family monovalent cation:H+ antiporter-2
VLILLLILAVAKTGLNAAILKFLGQSWPNAFLAGALLAQIGEFSFLLAAIGRSSGTIDDYNHKLVVCMTVLSLALSPFWLLSARRLQRIALLGVTSSRETIRILYGSETRQVADLFGPIWAVLRERLRRRDDGAKLGPAAATGRAAATAPDRPTEGSDDASKRPPDQT